MEGTFIFFWGDFGVLRLVGLYLFGRNGFLGCFGVVLGRFCWGGVRGFLLRFLLRGVYFGVLECWRREVCYFLGVLECLGGVVFGVIFFGLVVLGGFVFWDFIFNK